MLILFTSPKKIVWPTSWPDFGTPSLQLCKFRSLLPLPRWISAFSTYALTLLFPCYSSCIPERCQKPSGRFLRQDFRRMHKVHLPSVLSASLPTHLHTWTCLNLLQTYRLAHSLGEKGQDFSHAPLATRGVYMVGRGCKFSTLDWCLF